MSDLWEQYRFSDLRPMLVSILNRFRFLYDEINSWFILWLPFRTMLLRRGRFFSVRDRFELMLDGHLVCLLGSYFYCPASFTYPLCCYFLLGFLLMFPPGFFPTTNSAVCFLFFGFVWSVGWASVLFMVFRLYFRMVYLKVNTII